MNSDNGLEFNQKLLNYQLQIYKKNQPQVLLLQLHNKLNKLLVKLKEVKLKFKKINLNKKLKKSTNLKLKS